MNPEVRLIGFLYAHGFLARILAQDRFQLVWGVLRSSSRPIQADPRPPYDGVWRSES